MHETETLSATAHDISGFELDADAVKPGVRHTVHGAVALTVSDCLLIGVSTPSPVSMD